MGEVERIQVEARWNRVWRPWELQGGRWLVVVAGDGSGARDGRSRGADGGRGRSVAAPWGGDDVEEGRLQGQRWWKMRATTMSGLRRRQGRSRAREEVEAGGHGVWDEAGDARRTWVDGAVRSTRWCRAAPLAEGREAAAVRRRGAVEEGSGTSLQGGWDGARHRGDGLMHGGWRQVGRAAE